MLGLEEPLLKSGRIDEKLPSIVTNWEEMCLRSVVF